MKTLTLLEASAFLHMHPMTVALKARRGLIPGAKPGKHWVFLEDDLVIWLRSRYIPRRQMPEGKEQPQWQSTDVTTQGSGGSASASMDEKYAELLGLPTRGMPRNTRRS